MEALGSLALALGAAWGSGINLYATALVLGGLQAFGIVTLPEEMQILGSTPVLIAAAVLYAVEFLADKVPGVDSLWDALHTFIRIPAGAMLAAGAFGGTEGEWQAVLALLAGGAMAAGSHSAKAGTRAVINTSPEPFTNIGMSLAEDVMVFGGMVLAVFQPVPFLVALALFIVLLIWLLPKIWRGIIRFFKGLRHPSSFRTDRLALAKPGGGGNRQGASNDADFFD